MCDNPINLILTAEHDYVKVPIGKLLISIADASSQANRLWKESSD